MKKVTETARIIGQRIRELRRQRLLTQEKLAELSGIDSKHIQLMEGSRPSNPRIDTIISICRALNISLNDFFSESIEKKLESISSSGIDSEKYLRIDDSLKGNTIRFRSDSGYEEIRPSKDFLKFLSGREIILEDKWIFCLYTENPVNRGQLDILFKNLYKSYIDARPEEIHALWDMVKKAKIYLDREFAPDWYDIRFALEGRGKKAESYFVISVIPAFNENQS